MLFPYNTDAPVYHLPIVTIALILINSLIYAATAGYIASNDIGPIEPYLLHFGKGLYPTQWLTSNFLHINWIHLLGNMLFLWTFGLIVEGKIGWWRFLLLYLALGMLTMGATQVAGLGMTGGYGLGASGAIFGLIGMALIWAPENDVHCLLFLWIRPIMLTMTVWTLALLYLILQLLWMGLFSGLAVSSELIHTLGAVFGIGAGIAMLKLDWVDCENWDLFSVWSGRHTMSPERREALDGSATPPPTRDEETARRNEMIGQIHELLATGRVELALAVHRKIAQADSQWQLPEPELRALIVALLKQQKSAEVIGLMREYIDRFPDQSGVMRLNLAQVLLQHERRPGAARRILSKIPKGTLTPAHVDVCHALLRKIARAEREQEEATFDLQDDN